MSVLKSPFKLTESMLNKPLLVTEFISHNDTQSDLESIGFYKGASLEVIAKLPFKGPIVCRHKGATIAIRHDDACDICVCSKD